jgi:hypothetical protein
MTPTAKKRLWSAAIVAVTFAVVAQLVTPSVAFATASEYYVATNGSDSNPGSISQPFRTLERARQAVRDLKAGSGLPSGGVNINLRAGEYQRNGSFSLGAEDSGTAGSPVTYRAYNGENVEIVGGSTLAGSDFTAITDTAVSNRLDSTVRPLVKQYDLAAHGITEYGEIIQTGFGINGTSAAPELFFNDAVQTLSRYPNTGFLNIGTVQDPGSDPRNSSTPPPYTHPLPAIFDHGATFTYSGSEPDTWLNDGNIWMYGYWYWDWADGNLRVENIDTVNKRITTDTASVYSVRAGQRYYYYNVLEELDTPGEYYLDRSSGKLYFYPPSTLSGATLSLSTQTAPLVDVVGASYVKFQGLTFKTSRGDAVHIDQGAGDRVVDSTFTNLGGVAVNILGGTDHGVEGNEISRTGKGGVVIAGGDRATLTPGRNFARNNVIHDYSRLALTYNPGIQLYGDGNEASHNEIYNAPHQAIQFEGNDQVIEYNHIHHVVQQTSDSGAIYGARDWAAGGTVIRYNYIHDLGGAGAPSQDQEGIYLDDMLSGIEVYGNILVAVPLPLLIGGGRNNVVENNITIGGGLAFDNRGEGWAAKHCIPGGTLPTELAQLPYQQEPWRSRFPYLLTVQSDSPCSPKYNSVQRNVFQGAAPSIAASVTASGRVTGNWQTSTVASALGFVDYAGGDLRLRGDSPIYTNTPGFQPIPFQLIGPQAAPATAGLEIGTEGWSGTARVSTEQAHSGFTSYKPTADIETLTHSVGTTADGTVEMWFYDDAADTTVQAMGNVPSTGASWRGIGVATTHSTSKYVYRVDSTFTTTAVNRTTGWHRLTWVYEPGSSMTMSLDGSEIARVPNSPSFSTVELGDWWADGCTGNVYFDDVSVLAPPVPPLEIGLDRNNWQGVRNISTAQVHGGYSSQAIVGETDWLTNSLGSARNGTVRMWFYDDAADTTMQALGNVPAFGVASGWRALGVDTNTSTTKYTYRVDGVLTATAVTRTTGWHEFVWVYGTGTTATLSIDGQLVATVANSDTFDRIEIGDTWSNGMSGAVYFDDITVS